MVGEGGRGRRRRGKDGGRREWSFVMLGWSPLGFSKHVKHRCTGGELHQFSYFSLIVINFPEQEIVSCFELNNLIYTLNINVSM